MNLTHVAEYVIQSVVYLKLGVDNFRIQRLKFNELYWIELNECSLRLSEGKFISEIISFFKYFFEFFEMASKPKVD